MDLYSGKPIWIAGAGPSPVRPLVHDLSCDVVIVGGGVTGALVADALLDAGLSVAVLDKGPPGLGSTAASTALLMYELDVPLHKLAEKIGRARARRAYRLGVEAVDRIEALCHQLPPCGFSRRAAVYFARTPAKVTELRQEFDARHAAGLRVEWAERGPARERFGMDVAAMIVSADGAQVDPYRFTHHLLRRGAARGALVFGDSPVTAIVPEAEGAVVSTARGLRVRARRAIVATGYEAQDYVRQPTVELSSTYVLSCRARTPRSEQPIAWEFASPYLYTRWTEDGRLLAGGADEGFTDTCARDRLLPGKARELLHAARALYPDLDLQPEASWTGTFGSTADGLGFVGADRRTPHVLYVLGFGGNGITLSAAGAGIVKDLVMERSNADAAMFALDR